jgi:hypothetical protein
MVTQFERLDGHHSKRTSQNERLSSNGVRSLCSRLAALECSSAAATLSRAQQSNKALYGDGRRFSIQIYRNRKLNGRNRTAQSLGAPHLRLHRSGLPPTTGRGEMIMQRQTVSGAQTMRFCFALTPLSSSSRDRWCQGRTTTPRCHANPTAAADEAAVRTRGNIRLHHWSSLKC